MSASSDNESLLASAISMKLVQSAPNPMWRLNVLAAALNALAALAAERLGCCSDRPLLRVRRATRVAEPSCGGHSPPEALR